MISQDQVLTALKAVKYPGFTRDIVSFGIVKDISVSSGTVTVTIQLTTVNPDVGQHLKGEAENALRSLPGVEQVVVEIRQPSPTAAGSAGANQWAGQARVPGVGKILAVASGKGGVGKSTVSVNLACAFQRLGIKTGLLDCDIYGPSIPLMMGCRERPEVSEDQRLIPPVSHGIKLMSIGFLVEDDQPVIWRGPMIVKTIQQFLMQTAWDDLDLLLVDLPPGTGDAQLTLCQSAPLDGGVIVTTPQEASLGVVRKGIAMFQKLNVPVLGLIENMSFFTAPDGTRVEIFGHGGGAAEASRLRIPFLGEIPIFTEIRIGGDMGIPVVVSDSDEPPGQAFLKVAESLRARLS
jgi:ATP-binding protein involved in chromosome partitioning